MESRSRQLLEFPKVLDLLARFAASEAGANACALVAPIKDEELRTRETELLSQWTAWRLETEFVMESFPDLGGLFEYLSRPTAILDLDALWAVTQVLRQARGVRETLAQADPGRWPLLVEESETPWPQTVWPALKRCMGNDGLLRDEASPELFSVRQEIRRLHRQCTGRVKEFLAGQDISQYLQEDFITISSDRYVLPLKANFKGRVKGIVHDYSQTGETCYIEPFFLVELNNGLQDLKREEREAEREVLSFLTGLVRREIDDLSGMFDFMVQADLRTAKVLMAAELDARPVAGGSEQGLRLEDARHPLLAWAAKKGGGEVVPVDLELLPGQRGLIVSGGNAGGKTVCLKTLGLFALMAASAIPVTASEGGTMPAFKRVVVLLGDEQSIENSLSTFTAQIKFLSQAAEVVDDSTLVIMDEFGAGTDPSQGAALAQAVLDYLLERGAWVALATHFPAIKAYAMTSDKVRPASVLFDPRTKRPLFRLAYDQVGGSQALDVAREHGLPEEILQRASNYLLLDGTDTSQTLARLNELAVEREREIEGLEREREKFREKRLRFDKTMAREKKALVEEMREKSQEIMRQWQDGRKGRKQALRELSQARRELSKDESPVEQSAQALDWDALAPGDAVFYRAWNKPGVVREKDERRKKAKVDVAGVAVWTDFADLGPAVKSGGQAPRPSIKSAPDGERIAALALDLRGKRADVAVAELERFMDKAILSGHDRLEIIHGRGTGALRREVHDCLKNFPTVRTFALAPEDRGGDGMTEVELV